MDGKLEDLLKDHEHLHYDTTLNRVVCHLTGHQLPGKYDAVLSYINCKKYKLACGNFRIPSSEFLKASTDPKHKNQLHCVLTWRFINPIPNHIKRHLEGRRFKKALLRYNQCLAEGVEFVPNTSKYTGANSKSTNQNGAKVETQGIDFDDEEEDESDDEDIENIDSIISHEEGCQAMDEVVPSKKRKLCENST